jgi:hypothetical protein
MTKVLELKYITKKGKISINKENTKSKRNWMLRSTIRATGGKLEFIDGGLRFQHFVFKNMTGDLNSPGNKLSENYKEIGFKKIIESLKKYGCIIDIDYKVEFVDI